MTKLVCVKCQTEYSSALGEIGVIVVEMAHNPPVPYKAWSADLLKCPGCGAEVVSGFPDKPIARDEAAAVLLADTQRIGKARIVYDYERPADGAAVAGGHAMTARNTLSHDEMLRMVSAMNRYGGAFVHALSECFILADSDNLVRLLRAFPEYVEQYCEMAREDERGRKP
jgi:hypothetical protein